MNLKSYIPHSHKYQPLRLSELVFIELLANFFIYICIGNIQDLKFLVRSTAKMQIFIERQSSRCCQLSRLYGGLIPVAEKIAKMIKHMNSIFFESVKFTKITNHSTKIISRK